MSLFPDYCSFENHEMIIAQAITNAEECDATKNNSSNIARLINILFAVLVMKK